MNVVDSSGWLEYFADGPNASFFSRPLQKTSELVVPTITLYEVFKAVLRQRNESDALRQARAMPYSRLPVLRKKYRGEEE
jgi:toxin FitB